MPGSKLGVLVAAWDSSKLNRPTKTGATIDYLRQLHMRGQYNTVAEISGHLIADGDKRMTRELALHLHKNGFSQPLGAVVLTAARAARALADAEVAPGSCG